MGPLESLYLMHLHVRGRNKAGCMDPNTLPPGFIIPLVLRILGKKLFAEFSEGLLQKLSCIQKVLPKLCNGDLGHHYSTTIPALGLRRGSGEGGSLQCLQCLSCTKLNDLGLNC